MSQSQLVAVIIVSALFVLLLVLAYCGNSYSLNRIKNKQIGLSKKRSVSVIVRKLSNATYRTNRKPSGRKMCLNKKHGRESVLLAVGICIVAKINQNLC